MSGECQDRLLVLGRVRGEREGGDEVRGVGCCAQYWAAPCLSGC